MSEPQIPPARDLCRKCSGSEPPHVRFLYWPVDAVLSSADRDALCEWVRCHGIEPNDVSALAVQFVADGKSQIHATVFSSDENGKRFVDLAINEAVTHPVAVPLLSLPPVPGTCESPAERKHAETAARLVRLGWISPPKE